MLTLLVWPKGLIRISIRKPRYIWDSFLHFYGLETRTVYPVTQQTDGSMGEIRSKKHSNFTRRCDNLFIRNYRPKLFSGICLYLGFYPQCSIFKSMGLEEACHPVTLVNWVLPECYGHWWLLQLRNVGRLEKVQKRCQNRSAGKGRAGAGFVGMDFAKVSKH